jgi:hypothetical protein
MKINQVDKEALRRLSEIEGEAMSVVIRRVLREEFERRGLLVRKPYRNSQNFDFGDNALNSKEIGT